MYVYRFWNEIIFLLGSYDKYGSENSSVFPVCLWRRGENDEMPVLLYSCSSLLYWSGTNKQTDIRTDEPIDRHCIFYIFFLKNLLPNLVTFVALLMDIIFLSIFFLYFRKTSPNLRIIGYAQDVPFVRLVAQLISRRIGKIHR